MYGDMPETRKTGVIPDHQPHYHYYCSLWIKEAYRRLVKPSTSVVQPPQPSCRVEVFSLLGCLFIS